MDNPDYADIYIVMKDGSLKYQTTVYNPSPVIEKLTGEGFMVRVEYFTVEEESPTVKYFYP